MSFLSLSALWFGLTLPVVILFYLLKKRRKIHLVSSTVLWERFLTDSQANAPFQKLRRNLLLFLQLLLLLLAVLALARPFFANQLTGGSLQILVLDASASMKSVDVSPSRFEVAKELALGLVDSLRDGDQMVVVVAGARTSVAQSPTSEKSVLRRTLESIDVTDGPTRLREALELAETLVRDHPSSEIHLVSDGAVSDLADWNDADLALRFHQVGTGGSNVGIVSMDVRPNPEDPNTRAIFASMVNFSTNEFRFPVELRFDNQMIETRMVNLEAGGSESLAFIANQFTNGVFNLHLELEDDLDVDNTVDIVSLLPEPAKVLLYSAGNRFLEKALRAADEIELGVTDDISFVPDEQDIVVLDGLTPLEWPSQNLLAINVVHTNWFGGWDNVSAPPIVDWKGSHPLLRFVTFDDVEIAESYQVRSPFWGETLVESSQSPLIVAGEQGGQRRLWVGFDTLQSTWPLRVSFPMFVANAVQWLNPSLSLGQSLNLQTGTPLEMALENEQLEYAVETPSGAKEAVYIQSELGSLLYGNTMERGLYRVSDGIDTFQFAANLLDAGESDITPREALALSGGRQVLASVETRADLEIWRWFALAAFFLLLFEWWYFHKRTV